MLLAILIDTLDVIVLILESRTYTGWQKREQRRTDGSLDGEIVTFLISDNS